MQHALASDLTSDTNDHPDTTLATQPDRQQWNPKCRCKQCTGQGLGWITHVKPKNSQASNQGMNDRFTFDPATGEIVADDPLPALRAAVAADPSVTSVVVVTDPHAVEDTFRQDWASKARDALDLPVLHLYRGTSMLG